MLFSTSIARPLQLATRTLQWSSAVIVMGLTSFFIKRGPLGLHIIYQEVIARHPSPGFIFGANALQAVLSVVFFLPAFTSPFLPTALGKYVLLIDVIFSYLWLTAFIFAAQDYNQGMCFFNSPPGITCDRKKANEAFIFLGFIFTFFGVFLELASLWAYQKENAGGQTIQEKHEAGARAPLDAPIDAPVRYTPAPAGTV